MYGHLWSTPLIIMTFFKCAAYSYMGVITGKISREIEKRNKRNAPSMVYGGNTKGAYII